MDFTSFLATLTGAKMGARDTTWTEVPLGDLPFPTGRPILWDPTSEWVAHVDGPFADHALPPGTHPASMIVGETSRDRRVAFLRVRASDDLIEAWA